MRFTDIDLEVKLKFRKDPKRCQFRKVEPVPRYEE